MKYRQLCPKEKVILALSAKGLTVAEVAKKLELQENTVTGLLTRAYPKLNAANKVEAIAICLQRNLLEGFLEED